MHPKAFQLAIVNSTAITSINHQVNLLSKSPKDYPQRRKFSSELYLYSDNLLCPVYIGTVQEPLPRSHD